MNHNSKFKTCLPPSKIQNSKLGFTLIELLVVISILGLFAGLVISNVAGVRERARDAQSKSDLKEIQNDLEMYKHNQNSPSYPIINDVWGDLTTVLSSGYMKSVPNDPLPTQTYHYSAVAATPLHYTLWVCLENASDPQKDTVAVNPCTTSFLRSEP